MSSYSNGEKDKKISLLLDDLSALEEYIRSLFAFAPLPICFVTPLGVILEANPAFGTLVNYEPHEVIGESLDKLFSKKDSLALIKQSLTKDVVEHKELKLLPRAAKRKTVLIFTRRRKDEKGEMVGFFLGALDITTIRKTEKELQKARSALIIALGDSEKARQKAEEEREKTQAIITNFTDGLLVFDRKRRLTLINPQAESFLGIKRGQIIGRTLLELSKSKKFKPLATLLGLERKRIYREEWEVGENFVLQVSVIPLTTAGVETSTLVILHDISREKTVERLKTEFVSISAHQLRTPLSAIKWSLEMLSDGSLGKLSKEQQEFLEMTQQSNERMIVLVNSLLNVARIEEGRWLYKPALIEFDRLVKSAIAAFAGDLKRRDIKLRYRRVGKLPKITADKERMRLAVQNLVDNAVRYTSPGGEITISLKKEGKEIKFKIKDTGLGIPKAQQKRVFSKFFRGSNVMRLATEGTGLGLFITKNVIETHGGKIRFKSEEGRGTTFDFTLPISTPPLSQKRAGEKEGS